MALVHVEITINEELLSEHAYRVEENIRQKTWECYCSLSLLALEAREGRGAAAVLARIYFLIDDCINYLYNVYKKKQEERELEEQLLFKHTLLCQCGWNNCISYTSSIDTYVNKIKAC